jgi:hypothetical protein
MEGAKTEGIADAVKNLGGMMPGGAKGDGGGFSLSSLSKEISTSVSSVTSGSSTTKQVQSDDSKQAQTEMANLKKQFESDWASRKSVIIDGMAVEDRKFSKVQAAMKADDEAIKIKEDYAKKQEEIQIEVTTQTSPSHYNNKLEYASENKIESVPQTKTQSGRFKEHNLDKIIETQATLENPVSVKIELPLKQDITAPKTEMLVSKDTKTETVEGNPETESGDNNLSDEVKLPEPEIKKDYPVVNNAISPDGDGLNDELVIEMPAVDFYHLRIFTKKGVLVFETENVNVKWKGLVLGSGQYADNGEYRYILEYQIKGKENVKVIGGYIFLSR